MTLTRKHMIPILLTFWLLPILACGGSVNLPSAAELQDEAETAATTAAVAAATAEVMADQAVDTAATAAASDQAQNAAATAEALAQGGADAAATAASDPEAAATAADLTLPDAEALQRKFAAVQPDADGNVTVTITDDELNQVIAAKQSATAQSGGENVVQNTAVTFTNGTIILTGNITTPITANLTIVFRPIVVNGTLQFEVVNATINDRAVPASVLTTAEATLNTTLGEAMSAMPNNITLQSVVIGEGTMTVTGSRQ